MIVFFRCTYMPPVIPSILLEPCVFLVVIIPPRFKRFEIKWSRWCWIQSEFYLNFHLYTEVSYLHLSIDSLQLRIYHKFHFTNSLFSHDGMSSISCNVNTVFFMEPYNGGKVKSCAYVLKFASMFFIWITQVNDFLLYIHHLFIAVFVKNHAFTLGQPSFNNDYKGQIETGRDIGQSNQPQCVLTIQFSFSRKQSSWINELK